MNPLFQIRSIPDALRAIGVSMVIVAALFKIQHWPGADALSIAAWGAVFAAMVSRPLSGQVLLHIETARDLLVFGLVSSVVMRTFHLPGKGVALAVAVIGGVAVLWLERDRFLPGNGDRSSKPWLFYLAMAAVLFGTLFRIQNWPYGTELLLGGLLLCAIWFLRSMRSEDEEGS